MSPPGSIPLFSGERIKVPAASSTRVVLTLSLLAKFTSSAHHARASSPPLSIRYSLAFPNDGLIDEIVQIQPRRLSIGQNNLVRLARIKVVNLVELGLKDLGGGGPGGGEGRVAVEGDGVGSVVELFGAVEGDAEGRRGVRWVSRSMGVGIS